MSEKMHPLKKARRDHHNLTQQQLADFTGLTRSTIERAERGEPVSLYTRQKLCAYFDKTAQELGLVSEEQAAMKRNQGNEREPLPVNVSPVAQRGASFLLTHRQPVPLLFETTEEMSEQQLGAWFVLEASTLVQLFDEGWTLDTLMEALQVVMKGVQAMPKFSRRRLLELGAAAVVSNVVIPEGCHPSAEDRMQL